MIALTVPLDSAQESPITRNNLEIIQSSVAGLKPFMVLHKEEIDSNAPHPKGKSVRLSSFANANLMHDVVTGRSVSGILESINQTPINWFRKQQSQVETATYGSKFMVA